jgi:hypothetical protein
MRKLIWPVGLKNMRTYSKYRIFKFCPEFANFSQCSKWISGFERMLKFWNLFLFAQKTLNTKRTASQLIYQKRVLKFQEFPKKKWDVVQKISKLWTFFVINWFHDSKSSISESKIQPFKKMRRWFRPILILKVILDEIFWVHTFFIRYSR